MRVVDVSARLTIGGPRPLDGEAGGAALEVERTLERGVRDVDVQGVHAPIEKDRVESETQNAPVDGGGDLHGIRIGHHAAQGVALNVLHGDPEYRAGERLRGRVGDVDDDTVTPIESRLRLLSPVQNGHLMDRGQTLEGGSLL